MLCHFAGAQSHFVTSFLADYRVVVEGSWGKSADMAGGRGYLVAW